MFSPGDKVEFYSDGQWKPGVVAPMVKLGGDFGLDRLTAVNKLNVRIHTGNKVYVVRKVSKVRKAQ